MENPIFNIIGALPQGHEKPLKQAIYNALAMLLLFMVSGAVWALYVILGPFVKPLMWALLVGSVLYPIKYTLASKLHSWFNQMQSTNTPALVGFFIIPINIINDLSEFIGSNLIKRLKIIVGLAVVLPLLHVLYYYTPRLFLCILWKLTVYTNAFLSWFIGHLTTPLIAIFLLGYVSILYTLWTPKTNNLFHGLSLLVWTVISCYVAHFFNGFQVGAFIFLQLIFLLGLYTEVYHLHENLKTKEHKTFIQCLFLVLNNNKSFFNIEELQENTSSKTIASQNVDKSDSNIPDSSKADILQKKTDDEISPSKVEAHISAVSTDSTLSSRTKLTNTDLSVLTDPATKKLYLAAPLTKTKSSCMSLPQSQLYNKKRSLVPHMNAKTHTKSDSYIYLLFWACGVMILWKNLTFLPILFIPILIYILKHFGIYLGLWKLLNEYVQSASEATNNWCIARSDALIPAHIRGLYKCFQTVNAALKGQISESIDIMSSCVVILGVIIFVMCSSVYIAFQIYSETILLVDKTSHVINETIINNPELRKFLPPSVEESLDQFLDNAYIYGRDGVKKVVRGMMTDVDSPKSEKFEKQVLELFDRIYQSWMQSHYNEQGPTVSSAAIQKSWNEFWHDITTTPEMFNFSSLYNFIKQNIGTFASITESVWGLFIGNISLIIGSFSAFFGILLGGGTVVLNFFLNMVVFFTTLFYLLSSSKDLYKPVEMLSNIAPYSGGRHFGKALEGAINGVFQASFKMALFYGLWTWLIHNLFSVQIVYIPSAFAAILGAVPFLGTYWACIPAVLDLWLAQNSGFLAILLFIFQILPMCFVDTAIYDEIEGGSHPYLTGLAVAGGIFCLGVEGAIIGPLLLCGLYVAINLSSSLFLSPSEESVELPGSVQTASPSR